MPNHYDQMKTEDFDRLLAEVIDEENSKASDLLAIPGIYEYLSEEYHNAVLEAWDAEQAEQAEEQNNEEDIPS